MRFKKLTAGFLAAAMGILAVAAPFNGVLDFSDLFEVKAGAEVVTDSYKTQYGISYHDFFRYGSYVYLTTDNSVFEVDGEMQTLCGNALSANTADWGKAFLTGLQEGSDVILSSIGSLLGFSDSYKEQCLDAVTLKFVENFNAMNTDLKDKVTKLSKSYSNAYKSAKTLISYEKDVMISDLKESASNLSNDDIKKIVDNSFDSYSDIMGQVDDGINFAELVVSTVALKDIELEEINILQQYIPNGELYDGLYRLEQKVHKSIAENLISEMLKDKAFSTISKSIKSFIVDAATDGLPGNFASMLVDVTVKLAFAVIQPVTAKDHIYSTYSYSFTQSCKIAYNDMLIKFSQYNNYYSTGMGPSKFEEDIENLQVVYNAYVAALKTCMQYTKKIDSSSMKYRYDIFLNLIDTNKVNFSNLMTHYMTAAKKALSDGTITVPASSSSAPSVDKSKIEAESADIVKTRFEEFQKKYPPNVGMTWTGSYKGGIQCFGFGRMFFDYVFGLYLPCYTSSARYMLKDQASITAVGVLHDKEVNVTNLKSLFSKAKLGDIVQICRGNDTQHTMIFVSKDDSGVTFYDCNFDQPPCTIKQHSMSYTWIAQTYSTDGASQAGLGLYRASNYSDMTTSTSAFTVYDDSVNYVVKDGVLVDYTGWQSVIEIPEDVKSIGANAFEDNKNIRYVYMTDNVTSIGDCAFRNCTSLKEIFFSNNLSSIGEEAFGNCSSLLGAQLPAKTKEIGKYAFRNCSDMSYINIPSGVEVINNSTFENCSSLISIVIPDTVTKIYGNAFNRCTSLSSVTLSKSVKEIKGGAFNNCEKLTSILIPKSLETCGDHDIFGNDSIFAYSGLKNVTFEKNITRIPAYLFCESDKITAIELPDTLTEIGYSAFEDCTSLLKIVIPDTVIKIGSTAFNRCTSLNSVTLSKSLNEIRGGAFSNCESLTSIVIPKSLEICGDHDQFGINSVFSYSGLENVTFEEGRTKIPAYLFRDCDKITAIELPDTITAIEYSAFENCTSLLKIVIPDTVTKIYGNAFNNCTSLNSVTLSKSLNEIKGGAFSNCESLTSIVIPKSLEICGDHDQFGINSVFSYSGLENITFEKGRTKIPDYIFRYCEKLSSIQLPDTVTEIGLSAFDNCTSLTKVVFPKSLTKIGNYAFRNCWSMADIDLPESLLEIGQCSFQNCSALTEVTLPDSITNIGSGAFMESVSISSINLPEELTNLGSYVFENCSSLESITLPEKIDNIPNSMFYGCTSLSDVIIPSNIKDIGESAFYNCDSLTKIVIPEGTTSIGWNAFEDCDLLTDVVISDTVEEISSSAFKGCESLSNVDLGNGIEYIGDDAFRLCPALTEIVLPKSLEEIGDNAFAECTKLTKVTIYPNTTTIPDNAFSYPAKTTVSGYAGTYAEEYASSRGMTFVALDKITADKLTYEVPAQEYTGEQIQPELKISDNGYMLQEGVDYEVTSYGDNIELGKGSVSVELIGTMYTGTIEIEFDIVPADFANVVCYSDGDAKHNGNWLTEGTDYTVKFRYDLDNETSDAVFRGMGNYTGTQTIYGEHKPLMEVSESGEKWTADLSDLTADQLSSVYRVEAAISVDGGFANGGIGCNDVNGEWQQQEVKADYSTGYSALNGLNGIGLDDDGNAFLQFEWWYLDDGATASLIALTLYDNDGNVIKSFDNIDNSLTYTIEDYDITIMGSDLSDTEVVIPESIDYDHVVAIGEGAFADSSKLTSVSIPFFVAEIGKNAFSGCTALTDVYYDGSVADWEDIEIADGNDLLLGAKIHFAVEDEHIHTPAEPIIENSIDPTCVEDGSYDEVIYCEECGEELSRDTITVPATGKHTFGEWKTTKAATCATAGAQTRTCSVCGKEETQTIPATGKHTYVDKVVAPTYTAQGYTEHTCSVCSDSYKDAYTAKKTVSNVSGLKIKGRAADALRLAWNKNTSADGYIIERKDGTKWTRVVKVTKNSTTEYRIAKLKAGTSYSYRIRAYKMDGKTARYSGYTTISAKTKPSTVTGLKVKGRASDALRLSWTKNTSAAGYIIERKDGNKWVRVVKITKNTTTEYRIPKLKAGTAYNFRIHAYTMDGKTALYGGNTTISARTNPSAVSGLKLKASAKNAVRLAWTKNTSADGYIIEMKSGSKWVRVGKVTKNSTVEFRKGSLKSKTSYSFRIKAYKMDGKTALYGATKTITVKTK